MEERLESEMILNEQDVLTLKSGPVSICVVTFNILNVVDMT